MIDNLENVYLLILRLSIRAVFLLYTLKKNKVINVLNNVFYLNNRSVTYISFYVLTYFYRLFTLKRKKTFTEFEQNHLLSLYKKQNHLLSFYKKFWILKIFSNCIPDLELKCIFTTFSKSTLKYVKNVKSCTI